MPLLDLPEWGYSERFGGCSNGVILREREELSILDGVQMSEGSPSFK
jgi:hypothetical protein